MAFDSLAALILFAAAIAAWRLAARARSVARINIRFAAMLFSALAVAHPVGLLLPDFAGLAPAVALIALSLGTTALALGLFALFARPLPPLAAALALMLALGAGLAASLSGAPTYALGCQVIGLGLMGALSIGALSSEPGRSLLSLLAVSALLCGGLTVMDGMAAAALLFFAAGLIGIARTSQPHVDRNGNLHRLAVIARR